VSVVVLLQIFLSQVVGNQAKGRVKGQIQLLTFPSKFTAPNMEACKALFSTLHYEETPTLTFLHDHLYSKAK
jgi:hypothetical protein